MEYATEKTKSNISFNEQFNKYVSHWKLFALVAIVVGLLAYLYLKYTPIEHKVSATILIKGEKSGMLSELSAFEDLSIIESTNKEVINEIEILKSRPLFESVVRKLKLNHTYFAKTKYAKREVELYQNRPFNTSVFTTDTIERKYADFIVNINSKDSFTIYNEKTGKSKQGKFGDTLPTSIGKIMLQVKPKYIREFVDSEVYLSVLPVADVVEDYKSKVGIGLVNKDANVISLSLNTRTVSKAKDILNGLVEAYNIDAVSDKNQIYENTASFIKERLEIINEELSDIELGVETYKTSNKITDVSSEANLFLENSSQNKKEVLETGTQLGLIDFMTKYLKKNLNGLLPANLGFSEEGIDRMIAQHNELLLKRDEVLKGTTQVNPVVISLNEKIENLRESLKESLKNQRISLKIRLRSLEKQDGLMNSKIASLPKQERQLRDIVRQQEIKETLYLYLLKKREETAISLAATVSNAKIIETAYSSKLPVKPKKRIVFLTSFLAVLLLPAMIIFVKDLFDVKIKNENDVKQLLDIPVIAEIPSAGENNKNITLRNDDRSVLAESFRIFETNLSFFSTNKATKKGKTILVTSTITGEGKTFIASNLSITLADPSKKTILLGLDLRAPKVSKYFNLKNKIGITNYVTDPSLNLDQTIIHANNYPNLDILRAGAVPPNPTEILKSERFIQLIQSLREQYDYIIIDTPPVSLVADALLLSSFVDLCLYVVRASYSDKRHLNGLEKLYTNNRFSKMAVVLNAVKVNTKNYYGYAYGDQRKIPKWKFWQNRR